MSSTKSVYSRKTEEEPEDQLGRDGGRLEAGRNTVRANNIDQSVVANNVAPNGDISFASEDRDTSSQPGSASYQSINADSVRVNGRIIYNSHHYYSDHRGRLEIPKWLSTLSVLSFDRKHRDTIEIFRKTPETGRWLLNHRDFLAWKNGSMRRVLCPGIPGAGKTVLASIVINHLQTSINQDTTACLFIYFDYRKHAQYTVRDLYMSLLAQLLKHRSHFSKETDNAFENFNKKAIIPSEVEVTEMLMAEMTSFSRVYIVIDALDECGVDSTRGEFLCTIRRFPANVSTLMTSRAGKEASSGVEADIEIPITAHDEDLKTYLDGRLHDPALGKLQALVGQGTDQFWNKALDTIIKKSEGMFLLAQLHMDYLVGNCNYTVLGFKESLCALPQTPDDVYQSTLERIAKQPEFKQTLAIRSLGWLIHTKRPLTISELLEAVAVEPNTREYGSLRIVPSEVLTSVCAGIIVVDAATKVVRLAHYTAAQYLREKERTRFQSFHSDIAKTCLTYLLLDDFGAPSSIPTRSNRTATDRRKKYSLLDYAANHWGDHVAAGPGNASTHTNP
ncbi:hypothetical protein F5Y16DRAFT_273516 [Xylariaceae sp. FL0255]|nr:hypothetical protein F5Y16DRAFT_273516 [Xylariaceae sp. FL0255]